MIESVLKEFGSECSATSREGIMHRKWVIIKEGEAGEAGQLTLAPFVAQEADLGHALHNAALLGCAVQQWRYK